LIIHQPEEVEAALAMWLADLGADTESNEKLSSAKKDSDA
jgi:hypothetical protein